MWNLLPCHPNDVRELPSVGFTIITTAPGDELGEGCSKAFTRCCRRSGHHEREHTNANVLPNDIMVAHTPTGAGAVASYTRP